MNGFALWQKFHYKQQEYRTYANDYAQDTVHSRLHFRTENYALVTRKWTARFKLRYFYYEVSVVFDFADMLAKKCIDAHLISPEKEEWLRYGIEKRLTTIIVGIPFIIIAVILSNTGTAIAFFFSYFFLRGRTNGYHSKTVFRCLVTSLALEIIFIGFLSKFITGIIVIPVILLVTLTVFLLAPYNDPNMALSEEEYKANQRGSRIRCGLLCLGCILFWSMHYETLAAGIALGGAMAGVLLCVAYILEWRNNNGKMEV